MKINILNKIVVLSVVMIFAFPMAVEAQTGRVFGRVTDATDGSAMPFVNVALMRPSDTLFVMGATTDESGRFDIKRVDTGSYLLQATFVGYQTVCQPFHVGRERSEINLNLRRGTTLDEVQVVAERPLYSMEGEKRLYNTKEDPSIQTGTASDALQNAPGVEVDAEGNITLRGVSSVEIWINDRPSHMNAEALKQYIKLLPANSIERIEVITNPSARYSTSGGVINIVTNQKVVRNELFCLGATGRSNPSLSPWMSYVWANEKVDLNIYLNADYTHHESQSEGSELLLTDEGEVSRRVNGQTDADNTSKGGYFGFNLNWNIDSNTHLATWMGTYPYWTRHGSNTRFEHLEYIPSMNDLGYVGNTYGKNFWGGGYMGAWFQHQFDTTGRKLSANFNGNLWSSKNQLDEHRDYSNPALDPMNRATNDASFSPSASIGVDYSHPLKNDWEIELGTEVDYGHNQSHNYLSNMYNYGPCGWYERDTLRSVNQFGNDVGLNGYATVQKRWGGLTVKLGLRAEENWLSNHKEHPDGIGSTEVDTAFFALVPSLHLSYQTPTFHSFSLSYTRRYSNPDAESLNPFITYDDYSYSVGNPALLASYTHNVEAAWNKYFMKFGSVGLEAYLRANTNEEGSLPGSAYSDYHGRWVNYSMPVNIGSSHTEGLTANITYRPSAFFNLRLYATLFNYAYNYDGFRDNKVSYSIRANAWAKLWDWLEVFANARYTSPSLQLYTMSVANKSIDFGCSSDFFERRLSVYVNVNDLFGWGEWGSNSTAPHYQTTGSTRFNTRFISLGLTWRIGKMELEAKARQGASEGSSPQM